MPHQLNVVGRRSRVTTRSRRWVRILVASGAISLATSVMPGPTAHAQCAEFDGNTIEADDSRDRDNAVEIPAGSVVTVHGEESGWVGAVVWVGPVPIPVGVSQARGETRVDLGGYEWVGVGLYRIDVFGPGAGACAGTFWVKVIGPSPFTTALGGGGIALILVGLGLAASSVVRGRRHRCSRRRGAIGGMLAGTGVLLVGQQAALPTTLLVDGVAIVVPSIVGWLIARAACAGAPLSITMTPLLEAPVVVAPGGIFDVRIGFALPVAAAARRRRHDDVTVQLVPGTSTVVDGQLRHTIDDRNDATRSIRLQATREVGEAHLTALYAVAGQTVAVARRPLWVADGGAPPASTATTSTAMTTTSTFDLPTTGTRAADLELRATYLGPRSQNVLQWTAETPHRNSITVPDRPILVDLGAEPENFTGGLLRGVAEGEGRPGISELLLGTGRQIARTLGPELIALINAAATTTAPRLPRLLLLTEEAEIPWELAAIEPSPAPGAPFLATQSVVGRWFLAPGTRSLPPPVRSGAGGRTIVASGQLPGARHEQAELMRRFGFVAVAPSMTAVLDAFERSGVIHIAAHGAWHHDEGRSLLELDDGRLTSSHVAGLRLAEHPFVFLNACDVASGVEGLGTASGFPAELVFAGAGGCVLPLWAVRDDLAAEFATAFYERVLGGDTPAVAIRELRTAATLGDVLSATPFAYQFIGHPDLTIGATTDTSSR